MLLSTSTPKMSNVQGELLIDYFGVGASHMRQMQVLSFDSETLTLKVVVDGQPVTLKSYGTQSCKHSIICENIEVAYIGDNHYAYRMGLMDFEEVPLFSDKFVEVAKGKTWVVMPTGDLTHGLVMVPIEIMPKVVTDITSWDNTSTTLFVWQYPDRYSLVVQNLATGEVYYGDFSLDTFDDLGRRGSILPGDTAWGYLHVEQYGDTDPYIRNFLYLSQSKPDLQTMQAAVDYYQLKHSSGGIKYGPGMVCFDLLYSPETPEDTAVAKQYCGVYITK
jgi:hypothetical protein